MFNDHKIRSAGNTSLNQLWSNGMKDPNNPLSENLDLYAEDMQGPTPFHDSDNNVVVEPVAIEESDMIKLRILQAIDPLMESTEMGIDVFAQAIEIAQEP